MFAVYVKHYNNCCVTHETY